MAHWPAKQTSIEWRVTLLSITNPSMNSIRRTVWTHGTQKSKDETKKIKLLDAV